MRWWNECNPVSTHHPQHHRCCCCYCCSHQMDSYCSHLIHQHVAVETPCSIFPFHHHHCAACSSSCFSGFNLSVTIVPWYSRFIVWTRWPRVSTRTRLVTLWHLLGTRCCLPLSVAADCMCFVCCIQFVVRFLRCKHRPLFVFFRK